MGRQAHSRRRSERHTIPILIAIDGNSGGTRSHRATERPKTKGWKMMSGAERRAGRRQERERDGGKLMLECAYERLHCACLCNKNLIIKMHSESKIKYLEWLNYKGLKNVVLSALLSRRHGRNREGKRGNMDICSTSADDASEREMKIHSQHGMDGAAGQGVSGTVRWAQRELIRASWKVCDECTVEDLAACVSVRV